MLVHQEGNAHLNRTVQHIHSLKKKAGVVINPATPAATLEEILIDADLILVMTVNPGFGGQNFLASTLPKIGRVREMIDRGNLKCELEVDGGIDAQTAPQAVKSGARVLVAGNAIFGATESVTAAMAKLRAAAKPDALFDQPAR